MLLSTILNWIIAVERNQIFEPLFEATSSDRNIRATFLTIFYFNDIQNVD